MSKMVCYVMHILNDVSIVIKFTVSKPYDKVKKQYWFSVRTG